jgi:hypothetical protein
MRKVNGTRESGSGWNGLGVLFNSCVYYFMPCGFLDVLGIYKLKKNKWSNYKYGQTMSEICGNVPKFVHSIWVGHG